MAYKFNPFTGTFDEVSAGGGSTNPGGSDTQVQFNDGDSFGADSGLTFNKTTNALTVGASTVDGGSAKIYGDIDLDDGGSFSTTVQAVTPTANRTISFPDATGTVALVSGANGTIQYNDAGTLKGNSDFTVDPDWNNASTVFTGLKLNVTDGTGGSPVSAAGSNLLDLQSGGTSKFSVDNNGKLTISGPSGDVLDANSIFQVSNSWVSFFSTSGIRGSNYTSVNNNNMTVGPGTRVSDSDPSGTITIKSGSARPDATTYIAGGALYLKGGDGAASSLVAANGGDINLDGGQGYGTGTAGNIVIGATRGNLVITDARDVILGTTTGTKIGTATTQKLGFYNATPVVQPTAVADATDAASAITQLNALLDRMRDLGLIAT